MACQIISAILIVARINEACVFFLALDILTALFCWLSEL